MSDLLFKSEYASTDSYLEIRRLPSGINIEVGSPSYQQAHHSLTPEDQADLAEALLRSLDRDTLESVVSSTYAKREEDGS